MSSAATSTARSLASAHPTAMLPCPICAVSLRAANLDAHLAKVHPGKSDQQPPWKGSDRRVIVTLVALLALALCGMLAFITSGAFVPGGPVAMAMVAVEVVLLLLVVAAFFGAFGATLTFDGDRLVLRHSFGLGRRGARLPAPIETGALLRPGNSVYRSETPTAPVREGRYLRVGDITIGCLQSTSFQAHWAPSGWRKGKARFTRDVNVDQATMVAIEYALVERGLLSLSLHDAR